MQSEHDFYWNRLSISEQETPERNLLVAMLERAILDLIGSAGESQACAFRWFESDDRRPFGFWWLCEHLDLNATRVREELPIEMKFGGKKIGSWKSNARGRKMLTGALVAIREAGARGG